MAQTGGIPMNRAHPLGNSPMCFLVAEDHDNPRQEGLQLCHPVFIKSISAPDYHIPPVTPSTEDHFLPAVVWCQTLTVSLDWRPFDCIFPPSPPQLALPHGLAISHLSFSLS